MFKSTTLNLFFYLWAKWGLLRVLHEACTGWKLHFGCLFYDKSLKKYRKICQNCFLSICRMLVEKIIPALREALTPEEFENCIYSQDGSPIQCTEWVWFFLNLVLCQSLHWFKALHWFNIQAKRQIFVNST